MIKFEQASEQYPVMPSWLFIGGPGVGKTTMLASAAKYLVKERGGKFLIINCEQKERAAVPAVRSCPPEVQIIHQPKWDDIQQIMTAEYRHFTAGIGIDGLHNYGRECMYNIQGIANLDRMNVGENFAPQIRHFLIFAERFRNHFETIAGRGFPLITTCLPKFDKDELSGEIFKSLSLWGQSSTNLPPIFTVVGVMDYVQAAGGEIYETKFRPERGFPSRDTQGILAPREKSDFGYLWSKYMQMLPTAPKATAVAAQPKVA
jgi:DNA polymerase III delta prime subunit